MRRFVVTLAALAAFGLALPVVASSTAEARDVVIIKKKHRDHGRHAGWHRGHHYGWDRGRHHHRGPKAKVVIKRD
jgi:Ni/Co efflux regulator RcnB